MKLSDLPKLNDTKPLSCFLLVRFDHGIYTHLKFVRQVTWMARTIDAALGL